MHARTSARFFHGNAFADIHREVLIDGPARQRELLAVSREQVRAQERAAKAIAESNLNAAGAISNEILMQTGRLEAALDSLGDTICGSITQNTDRLIAQLQALESSICSHLSEINWELRQQRVVLKDILRTLRSNRNVEAQQLVQQGVRHYANGEFLEARERFERALDFDTTDYQVLMNLGYVAVNLEDPEAALKWFKKASVLPPDLDASSRAAALAAVARSYYVLEQYSHAARSISDAHGIANKAANAYLAGTYHALALQVPQCLHWLRISIESEPAYIARAAVDPDLEGVRADVLAMICQLCVDARQSAEQSLKQARQEASNACQHAMIRESACSSIQMQLQCARRSFRGHSYSEYRLCVHNATMLRKAVSNLLSLTCKSDAIARKEREVLSLQKETQAISKRRADLGGFRNENFASRHWMAVSLLVIYSGPSVTLGATNGVEGMLLGILWPLLLGLGVISILLHGDLKGVPDVGAIVGGIILGCVAAVMVFISAVAKSERIKSLNAKILDVGEVSHRAEAKLAALFQECDDLKYQLDLIQV